MICPHREAVRSVRGSPVLQWTSSSWTGVYGDLNSQRRRIPRTDLITHSLRLVRSPVPEGNSFLTVGSSLAQRTSSCSIIAGSLVRKQAPAWLDLLFEEPSFLKEEVPCPEVQFAAVQSPRELVPAEPSLLDDRFQEEMYPECLSLVVQSARQLTPAGRSVVVRDYSWICIHSSSVPKEPTPAGRSEADRLPEETTPAEWESGELWFLEEPDPPELSLLWLLDIRSRECLSWSESAWPLLPRWFWYSQLRSPSYDDSFLDFLAGDGEASWSVSHGAVSCLAGTVVTIDLSCWRRKSE